MITRCSLFPILIFAITNLADVLSEVPSSTVQNSAAQYPFSPYTVNIPHPYSMPEELPFSPYTVYMPDEPDEPVPQPEPQRERELEPEPVHRRKREMPHPQPIQQSNRSRSAQSGHQPLHGSKNDSHVSSAQSKLQVGTKNESISSDRRSESSHQSEPNQNPIHIDHQRIIQDPLLHPVPVRHLKKFRVRMPSRTPLNMRRLFTFLNLKITKKFLLDNLHLVPKKTPASAPAQVAAVQQ